MAAWWAASSIYAVSTINTLKLCEIFDTREVADISKACAADSLTGPVSASEFWANRPISARGLCP
jgi:hypothetical protein